ncbi:UDP-N-acetylmuramoyl-L-alanine--D-glutamate ligase [Galbibacter sp.]|uniref:UDP-N-acetylmuramoyl-L-alanine--D-glutamate ligase n=1 Tax=Galbibacter sp. TaxID=2918471 RepID=UPI002BCBB2D3|nr:UDP-N-acetylmuramoyl-L-alanine--D-glutamate ligase [Galbibacter sp.]HLV62144.1 UDP-N-acetylmuramoyl-L-alanine--D-glutamate ligase [Galbibacter sp.]
MRLVVLGGGESGVGSAILAKKHGFDIFLSDKGKINDHYKNVLEDIGINWEDERHTESVILKADLVIKSPGIPDSSPLIIKLNELGVPVISEIEFASRYTDAMLIGITGSNGKTTTTMLTNHLLSTGGLQVGMAGNIGDSFAKMVAQKDLAYYVLEISSFQLDGIERFAPHIAVITNITPDHLDRYDYKFDNYIDSKFRITMNQTAADYLIYDGDDPVITTWLKVNKTQARLLPFSIEKKLEQGAYLEDNKIVITIDKHHFQMSTDTLALEGKHNVKNAMAASTVAQLLKIRKATIRESLENFQGAAHRLEKVLKIHNVHYINDSKATNVNATYYALDSMNTPTVWIVGGQDKGNDYLTLMPLVREKVKAIVCLGWDNAKIIETFGSVVEFIVETTSMEDAVRVSKEVAQPGDTVLLSPACASFDLFMNYQDRGDQFKEQVRKL